MRDDRVVLTENIAPTAGDAFTQAGIGNVRHLSQAVSLHDADCFSDAEVLGIRSRTTVTAALLDALPDLIAVGCFSVGTNQVDLDALADALRDGQLSGAAIDVFPVEPKSNAERFVSPLQGIPNVILTPYISGSTEGAQDRIGSEVARKLIDYIRAGSTLGAVNFPQVQLPPRVSGTRFLHTHRNVPGVLGRINAAFSSRSLNIDAQYLQTDGEIGYLVVDAAEAGDGGTILRDLQAIPGTVRTRRLQPPAPRP